MEDAEYEDAQEGLCFGGLVHHYKEHIQTKPIRGLRMLRREAEDLYDRAMPVNTQDRKEKS